MASIRAPRKPGMQYLRKLRIESHVAAVVSLPFDGSVSREGAKAQDSARQA
jgi:hypothetical protein